MVAGLLHDRCRLLERVSLVSSLVEVEARRLVVERNLFLLNARAKGAFVGELRHVHVQGVVQGGGRLLSWGTVELLLGRRSHDLGLVHAAVARLSGVGHDVVVLVDVLAAGRSD